MDTKVLVATHKNYEMPADQSLYLPIFVGKALHPDVNQTFQGDNTGDNISLKNSTYNELTALYWAWKNLNADAVGLDHYRRYLSLHHQKNLTTILTRAQIDTLFQKTDLILPKKRRYYIETNYSHYIHAHPQQPLDEARKIIGEQTPSYLTAFDDVMAKRSAHMFNMFIMKRPLFNQYCEWLFAILFELEKRTDISQYDDYNSRVYGFVSERLLDVWIEANQLSYHEVNFVFMEHQNWFIKGGRFLQRKFFPKIK